MRYSNTGICYLDTCGEQKCRVNRSTFGAYNRGKNKEKGIRKYPYKWPLFLLAVCFGFGFGFGAFNYFKCTVKLPCDERHHPSVNDHPNLVQLIGYCQNSKPLGVVYDLNPIDTLHNLIAKGILSDFVPYTFTWLQRIKVALGFARLLDFLHDREYMLRNIDAAHIMIDQDFNPRLFEFGSFSGGILGDKIKTDPFNRGTVGYLDHHSLLIVEWSVPCDIYTYGVVLLSLVAKRVVNKKKPEGTWVDLWAKKKYSARVDKEKRKNIWLRCLGKGELMQVEFSLVHPSLQKDLAYDACDGHKITRLAMNCLENGWLKRPTMKEMVQSLQELHVARSHGDAVGVKPVLDDTQSTETCQ
ncbi:hypothetical protein L1049_026858 [Liquidambar formosana]|uniref:Protein kinase domain-containing protein n=1 Tax=Liquidambar formosana TaxID=63359 RepID=A0AAP0NEH4_LIQFO